MNEQLELLKIRLLQLVEITTEDAMFRRINGLDWNGYTMIGLRRLDNLEMCIKTILAEGIPGAIVEAGVWRGGAMIFAAGALREYNFEGLARNIYVCDIFDGTFPEPTNALDEWTTKHDFSPLSVPLAEVEDNFNIFSLLTPNIIFKKGWFSETLPTITEQVAILRIDGDTYQSTMESLQLERQMPSGGFIIMDDWAIESSKAAFQDYFHGNVGDNGGINDVIHVDSLSAYWRKP